MNKNFKNYITIGVPFVIFVVHSFLNDLSMDYFFNNWINNNLCLLQAIKRKQILKICYEIIRAKFCFYNPQITNQVFNDLK
ncbi:hypothetical protein [Methanobrevibacter smithii]|uniref:hypothetical protein n=1 Tax=Methanobrevibacter smithii TaxID=2173 RepID=UPI00036FAB18|nr:hypothetical protein [Methanobrevibacter smithii]